MKTKRISVWKRWSTTRRENHCAQHTAKLTGADLADSVSFSNFRLVLAGDNAADGLLPSGLSRRPLAVMLIHFIWVYCRLPSLPMLSAFLFWGLSRFTTILAIYRLKSSLEKWNCGLVAGLFLQPALSRRLPVTRRYASLAPRYKPRLAFRT